MPTMVPVALIGNSLAVMVAATSLAKQGVDVVLINTTKNWGGHFTTITSGGAQFDPGMVLHEFTSFNPQSKGATLKSYDPSVRNDVGRFFAVVQDYIAQYQTTRPVATPSMFVEGQVLDDLLIANALHSLKSLSFAQTMKAELSGLQAASALHAIQKHRDSLFERFDFEAVSLANHGATMHSHLIESFCQKLLGVSSGEILALYHRVAWLPLYYPETLLSYLNDQPQELPPTVFSYPVAGCVGGLAADLKAEIDSSPHITVIGDRPTSLGHGKDGAYIASFEGRDSIGTTRLAWGNPLADLIRTLGGQSGVDYQKCSISLAFVRVRRDAIGRDFTVLNVVDLQFAAYRVINQSQCAGDGGDSVRLVIECNPDYLAKIGGASVDIGKHLLHELQALGVITEAAGVEFCEVKTMQNALMLPNKHNLDAHALESEAARNLAPEIALVGPSSGFFSSSLNDHIVQGLKLAGSWRI